ncbi:Leucyl/phenylalanyl-tRNA--protein transferase [Kingella potus]|uniref:Leucyl/phenylalanyl-tRNA--protein transferase n=1 Tax=Kingella potus TaxID=265175 RepID=A0A377R0T8_9NEIS|nr:leucyl/phenylalanyl-tRNA--protein transferase [Kingella potus]UOP00405.1 leucyl/phenylalanyl-tRNA--protein transferase [Kingella potus]STR02528.1 Leucyl/phenylalanyl-tRNA--protein transferase [Kingella potus]
MSVPFLPPHDYRFPDPGRALRETEGLVGVSADLDAGRLLSAYRAGVFPWFAEGGLFYWFAVSPRAVLLPERLHVGRSLAKTLRNKAYRVTANRCFQRVIAACASRPRPHQDGTWIAPEFQTAYARLHALGHAHSFECFFPDGAGRLRLAGGFYGVQIGRVFYGESMFADAPDASKTAFACAVPYLAGCGLALIDCQQDTEHLRRFGSHTVDFAAFQTALRDLNGQPLRREIGCGTVAENLCAGMEEAV